MYAHRRHDISDRVWEHIQAHLPGKKRGALVARTETTGYLSTRCSGYCERERHGAIRLLTLGTGKIPIAGFAVGVTGGFGKTSLKRSWLSLTMSG